MWIFTTSGFASIVQDSEDDDTLVVRARVASDLDELREIIDELSPTTRTPSRDYPYRATCRRLAFALGLTRLAMRIDYGNFKSAVAARQGWDREALYGQVWQVMNGAEEKLKLVPVPDRGLAPRPARKPSRRSRQAR